MNAAPRLYQGDPPSRWSISPNWTAAALISLASIVLLAYVGWTVTADSKNAASECRRATEEIRQAREDLQITRQRRNMLDRENERQAAVISVLQERLKKQLEKGP